MPGGGLMKETRVSPGFEPGDIFKKTLNTFLILW
jgi:hypothetical protein